MFLRISVHDLDILDITDLVERFDGFIRFNEVIVPETEEVVEYLCERNVRFKKLDFSG